MRIAAAAVAGSKQPLHAAERLEFAKAQSWIEGCRNHSASLALDAVRAMVAQVKREGYEVVGAALLYASGRVLPELRAILRSHALIHTAEGEFFREAMVHACGECALPVAKVKEREIWIGVPEDLQRCVADAGKAIGPPWRQDEKLASMAAWIALRQFHAVDDRVEPMA